MRLPWRPVKVQVGSAPLLQPIHTSLTENETKELASYASNALVLEIGAGYGYSAIVMARYATTVVSVDPMRGHGSLPDATRQFDANVHASGLEDRILPIRSDSFDACTQLARLGLLGKFDLVFIDGDHRAPAVCADVGWALQLLQADGALLCHDYGEDTCPDVASVLDQLYPNGPTRLVDTLWIKEDDFAGNPR